MAEIKLFYHKDGVVRVNRSLDFLKSNPIQNFLWIDLNDVDEEVENELEDFLKIYIQEEEEMIEIEMSSRKLPIIQFRDRSRIIYTEKQHTGDRPLGGADLLPRDGEKDIG